MADTERVNMHFFNDVSHTETLVLSEFLSVTSLLFGWNNS